ncbi:exopolysaccharide biosynthesis polyprenyl glycosylphosphotransferase [Pontibacter mangrovi]|uniref:Exopolysaccharide biosynthesis polyprenyl glycosylphosphotransferase n=1 Tax=Pontibacter mangrovi TaxID=2589816 RepID=A0A501W334_9BACT|nr:exopolysaccharide biosynthesis polyprenyl glycosylphosphotransferase [Pontibacter mangrovi]TPE42504.1 exopolysaccharide biosynthesis polyprenyl glycosylphosphotransferase [Pontibacter mangrovi]
MNNHRHIEPSYYLGGDLFTLTIAFFISIYFFNDSTFKELDWGLFSGVILLWFLIVHWRNLYAINLNDLSTRVLHFVKAYAILIAICFLFYTISPVPITNLPTMVAFAIAFPVLGIAVNMLVLNYVNYLKAQNRNQHFTLVAGIGGTAEAVEKQLLAYSEPGRVVKGFINCRRRRDCLVPQEKIVSDLDHIQDYLKYNQVDEIVIALPAKKTKKIRSIVAAADYYGVRVKYIPDYQDLFGNNYKVIRYGGLDVVNVRQMPLDETFSFFMKNTFDKVFSSAALVFLFPLFVLLAVLIKLDSPGPVFYYPTRIGKGGKPFKVIKFRSMRVNDNPDAGILSTRKDDDRITRLGKVLRKYSLDELPQFVNVLLGDMSVVGPRPHRSFLNQQLQASEDKYMIRHYFKPGITGWAQVNGWRGPTETKEQKSQRTLHDLWYMENWSLWLDLKIIYRTIFGKDTHKSAF